MGDYRILSIPTEEGRLFLPLAADLSSRAASLSILLLLNVIPLKSTFFNN
jgi:hypothetical protein